MPKYRMLSNSCFNIFSLLKDNLVWTHKKPRSQYSLISTDLGGCEEL